MEPEKSVCRNCKGSEFYMRWTNNEDLPLGNWKPYALCKVRICGKCGLAEWWVEKESLDIIKETYERDL